MVVQDVLELLLDSIIGWHWDIPGREHVVDDLLEDIHIPGGVGPELPHHLLIGDIPEVLLEILDGDLDVPDLLVGDSLLSEGGVTMI